MGIVKAAALWTALAMAGCAQPGPAETTDWSRAPSNALKQRENSETSAPIQFEDMTDRWGIVFSQVSGNSPEKHFPAANGSGLGMFDFDGDGRLDVYFLTARLLPFQAGFPGPANKLFRNIGHGQFEEVSAPAGLNLSLFCHGVIDGDLDNDGFTDLVLTTYGGTQLLRNNGDGTFGRFESFLDNRWGSSAAVADFDEDGCLDIYITHYGLWSIETNLQCGDTDRQIRTFCSPKRVTPAVHALYKNLGNGEFLDTTQQAGIARDDGRGQGVVTADFDLDGHMDLYVANDLTPNFLFLGKGDGTFRDQTEFCGAALSRDGLAQAGMGVDCGDVDRDGLPDLFVTNFRHEYNALYVNLGSAAFLDKSYALGVAGDSMDEVGWGTRLVDLDNDGWLDIFVTNGHVDDNIAQLDPNASYAELPKIWKNYGGRFRLVTGPIGSYFETKHVGRGAAFGDLDDDGRLDIAINHVDSAATVLRNVSPIDPEFPTPWIRFTLTGTSSNRDAVGACITLSGDGLPGKMIEQRQSGASYLSTHDHRVLIGIGKTRSIEEAVIRWPGGQVTRLENLQPGTEATLREPDH